MIIHCPYCEFAVKVQEQPAGKFATRCPSCQQRFAVAFSGVPGEPPKTAKSRPAGAPEGPSAAVSAIPDPRLDETIDYASPATDPLPPFLREPAPTPLDATVTEVQDAISLERTVRQSLDPVTGDDAIRTPRRIGRYWISRRLLASPIGPVFEGSDLATGRRRWLKTLRPRWAADAPYLSGLTRDAVAASVIRHPNLDPIVDVQADGGQWFAVYDAPDPVDSSSLPQDAEARAAQLLHAARGLLRAREEGLFHRDLSAGSIVDRGAGFVVLQDLGLGRKPPIHEPGQPIALSGPEDGDPKADVAQLSTLLESALVGTRPSAGLSEVVNRLRATGPNAVTSLPDWVRLVESGLALPTGPFSPTPEQSTALETAAAEFREASPLIKIRGQSLLGVAAGLGALIAFAALLGKWLAVMGLGLFGLVSFLAFLTVRGFLGESLLFEKLRLLVLGGKRSDWTVVGVGALLLVGLLWALHFLIPALILTALMVAGAVAFRHGVDVPIAEARRGPLSRIESLLAGLRRRGIGEADVRRFVCVGAGRDWEELYEALFGYEAKRLARLVWGTDPTGARRPRFAAWRDPLHDLLDGLLQSRQERRWREMLRMVEEARLVSEGTNLLTARRRSARIADAMIAVVRDRRSGMLPPDPPLVVALRKATLTPDSVLTTATSEFRPDGLRIRTFLDGVFGPTFRFLLGSLFLGGFLAWAIQNDIVSGREIQQTVAGAVESADGKKALDDAKAIGAKTLEKATKVAIEGQPTEPLRVPGVPDPIGSLFDGFGPGVAGLLLIASAVFAGGRLSLFAVPGALIAFFGSKLGVPPIGPISPVWISGAVGLALTAAGTFFRR